MNNKMKILFAVCCAGLISLREFAGCYYSGAGGSWRVDVHATGRHDPGGRHGPVELGRDWP